VSEQELSVLLLIDSGLRRKIEDLLPGFPGFFRVTVFQRKGQFTQELSLTGAELFEGVVDSLEGFLRLTRGLVQEGDFAQFDYLLKRRRFEVFFFGGRLLREGCQKTSCQAPEKFRAFHRFQLLEAFALKVQGRGTEQVDQELEAVILKRGRAVHHMQEQRTDFSGLRQRGFGGQILRKLWELRQKRGQTGKRGAPKVEIAARGAQEAGNVLPPIVERVVIPQRER